MPNDNTGLAKGPRFEQAWAPLRAIGCTFERFTRRYLGVDVPPEADIYEVYRLLEAGMLVGWLRGVDSRGDGWRMTRHRLDLSLVEGRLRMDELDGYFTPEGNSIGAA